MIFHKYFISNFKNLTSIDLNMPYTITGIIFKIIITTSPPRHECTLDKKIRNRLWKMTIKLMNVRYSCKTWVFLKT